MALLRHVDHILRSTRRLVWLGHEANEHEERTRTTHEPCWISPSELKLILRDSGAARSDGFGSISMLEHSIVGTLIFLGESRLPGFRAQWSFLITRLLVHRSPTYSLVHIGLQLSGVGRRRRCGRVCLMLRDLPRSPVDDRVRRFCTVLVTRPGVVKLPVTAHWHTSDGTKPMPPNLKPPKKISCRGPFHLVSRPRVSGSRSCSFEIPLCS